MRTAAGSGLWAVLFCLLLLYQLRDSSTREKKYRETIETLTDRLGELESVKSGINETLSILKSDRRGKKCEGEKSAAAAEEKKVNV